MGLYAKILSEGQASDAETLEIDLAAARAHDAIQLKRMTRLLTFYADLRAEYGVQGEDLLPRVDADLPTTRPRRKQ